MPRFLMTGWQLIACTVVYLLVQTMMGVSWTGEVVWFTAFALCAAKIPSLVDRLFAWINRLSLRKDAYGQPLDTH